MAVISKGQTFATGDQVSALKLNNLADNATFASGAVDNVSTQLSGGAIVVKDGGVTTAKLNDGSVTTAKIADDAVAPAKLSAGAPNWTSDGNVGINKSSPVYTLDVYGTVCSSGASNLPALVLNGNSSSEGDICVPDGYHLTFGHHTLDGGSNSFTERMRINSNGHITGAFVSAYPVGSIYMNASQSTNPSTLLGFGTWVSFGAGRVLVGIDGSQSEFNSIGETGGSKTHTLTTSQIPSHTHSVNPPSTTTSSNGSHNHTYQANKDGGVSESTDNRNGPNEQPAPASTFTTSTVGDHTHTLNIPSFTSGSSGGGESHNNLQPYIVVYMWQRTA